VSTAADIVSISGWRGAYGEPRRAVRKTDAERAADLKRALDIRRNSHPIGGTPGETYLRGRGLLPDVLLYGASGWPPSIRWADDVMRLPWPPVKPGIVIDVCDTATGAVTGIHRIIFRRDGTVERDADGKKNKKGLGGIWGRAAMLDCEPDPDGQWGIAEGVETAMAARQLYRIPVWAAVFGGNMRAITPPAWARRITIFSDHDAINPKLGYAPGAKFAADAMRAYRLRADVEDVRVLAPELVKDFADVLQGIAYG
jgi:hypothetical protein